MITSELNKKAWQIRKQAAAKFNCPVMEIVWGECLRMAKAGKGNGMLEELNEIASGFEVKDGELFYNGKEVGIIRKCEILGNHIMASPNAYRVKINGKTAQDIINQFNDKHYNK